MIRRNGLHAFHNQTVTFTSKLIITICYYCTNIESIIQCVPFFNRHDVHNKKRQTANVRSFVEKTWCVHHLTPTPFIVSHCLTFSCFPSALLPSLISNPLLFQMRQYFFWVFPAYILYVRWKSKCNEYTCKSCHGSLTP